MEVVTEDLNMSRIHIAIRKRKSGFTVKDMESLNGTRLNGEKLEKEDEVYLEDGDKILIGRTELLVNVTEQGKGLIEE